MTTPEIKVRERRPFAGGHTFGDVGPYEILKGRASFAFDPYAPANRPVVDLDLAPRDPSGRVRAETDLMILKPLDPRRGNHRLLFDFLNRGNKRAVHYFNNAPMANEPKTLADAGNGFLMRRGYTMVFAAWQADLHPGDGRMMLDVPVAELNGAPVTGTVRAEFIGQPGITTLPLSGRVPARSYPTVSRDTRDAILRRRRYPNATAQDILPNDWHFARIEVGPSAAGAQPETALIPSDTHIHIPRGFEPGWIYELLYAARDPLILGLGLPVIRDLVAALRAGPGPLRDEGLEVDKAYAWGRSQAGRCIREFVYQGFNEALDGSRVFDGVMPHIAGAGRLPIARFTNLSLAGGLQYEDRFATAEVFPFSYARSTDHLTGRDDALLKRPATDPLVVHSQSASEYWQRRASLVHTDTAGTDLAQPDTVRIYFLSSSQHVPDQAPSGPARTAGVHYLNAVDTSFIARPLLDHLDRWATAGSLPPASRIPMRASGTLVTFDAWRTQFPVIPGISLPRGVNELQPVELPAVGSYTVLVPSVDADGNDVAGIRAVDVAAPLGTYSGWNLRGRGTGHGALHEFSGSYIPFADTAEERLASGDPRPAVLERYDGPEAYVRAVAEAARWLVTAGFLLEDDVPSLLAAAANWGRPRHDVRL